MRLHLLWLAAGVGAACSPAPEAIGVSGPRQNAALPVPVAVVERVEVPPPPFTDGMFPCSGCHASTETNRTPRELTAMHAEIVLAHGERQRWCLDCHEAGDRDVLHLAGGQLVPFEESYRLCGQCHGKKLRDWRAGVHGRRSGQWNGHKSYLLCAHCHDPHRPRFAAVKPEPPPRRPVVIE